jgi:hypothetical protein
VGSRTGQPRRNIRSAQRPRPHAIGSAGWPGQRNLALRETRPRGLRPTRRSLPQLAALVKTRLSRMQYRPGLLDGFLAITYLNLTPFCNPLLKIVNPRQFSSPCSDPAANNVVRD